MQSIFRRLILFLQVESNYNILGEHIKVLECGYVTLPSYVGKCRNPTGSPPQQFYSSFTVNPVNPGEPWQTQKGLGKRISNPD